VKKLILDPRPFEQGYIAGWQSVRGADEQPPLIPPSPVFVGPAMYVVGYSRGARDARAVTPHRLIAVADGVKSESPQRYFTCVHCLVSPTHIQTHRRGSCEPWQWQNLMPAQCNSAA
jgi:hypothetical protein